MKELRTFHFVQMLYTKFGQNVFKIEKKISTWPMQGIPKRIQLLGNETKPPTKETSFHRFPVSYCFSTPALFYRFYYMKELQPSTFLT